MWWDKKHKIDRNDREARKKAGWVDPGDRPPNKDGCAPDLPGCGGCLFMVLFFIGFVVYQIIQLV